MKKIWMVLMLMAGWARPAQACTGISFTAKDGSYVQARTIEWARGPLESDYVIIPRGQRLVSDTPEGEGNGLAFTARYGVVGLSVVRKEYIAEGVNEAGLSAGLFFFPVYGAYQAYDTPPSRFVRAAFYCATAPQQPTAFRTVTQCFQLLNNFDIPVGIDHDSQEVPDIPSATQWTSAIDLTHRKVYYRTAYNSTIRCISLEEIDFGKVKYQAHPLDKVREQPVEHVAID